MSEVITFQPREFPDVVIDSETVIVTTNHLGADMLGDAGLDAQYLADVSGHTVVGLNRIGSGDNASYSRKFAKELNSRPEDVTERWSRIVCKELKKQAPSRVELVGRSAGANLILHVCALELIPDTDAVLAIESLRFESISTRRGQLKYAHYQLKREGKFKEQQDDIVDPDLAPSQDERPAAAASAMAMVKRQLIDIRHYQHLWASDLPFRNAIQVAKKDVAAGILLAEESLAAEQPMTNKLLAYLPVVRDTAGVVRPLLAESVARTTHGSFDDQRLYATHYRRFAALTTHK